VSDDDTAPPRRVIVALSLAVQRSRKHLAASESEVAQRPVIEGRESAHCRMHSAMNRSPALPTIDNKRQRNQRSSQPPQLSPDSCLHSDLLQCS
jgi:hypothetical protein